ncbi:hypothetical protein PVK06_043042 [Gossypium arboreum]|uniref:Uncharacterized protein n=1 Tax=Gossypium arboreum TaxID=29729 RepID=A0ABR0MMX0_GOSAR|nr:hypothetical protein PVK06_043042 [Gossypium arboreum]
MDDDAPPWDDAQMGCNTKVFDELVEKAVALKENLREKPKATSYRAIKRSTEVACGSGRKDKRGHFGRSR